MAQSFFPIEPVDVTPIRGGWQPVDVSSYVPIGATGVILHLVNVPMQVHYVGLRKKGSSDNRDQYLTERCHSWAMIGVDENRIFETTFTGYPGDVLIYLVGYTMAGATFFTNAPEITPEITGSWQTIDCSLECPGAIGLIFELIDTEVHTWHCFGLRKYGSTDNRYSQGIENHSLTPIIGCDNQQRTQVYIESPSQHLYLLGYITDGVSFYTNALEITSDALDAWFDLAPLPIGANMGIIDVFIKGGVTFGLRKNDSLEDIRKGTRRQWAIVECDRNGVIEGYVADDGSGRIKSGFFVIGYSERPSEKGILRVTSVPQGAEVYILE